jgi:L-asparagine transporter-like permease
MLNKIKSLRSLLFFMIVLLFIFIKNNEDILSVYIITIFMLILFNGYLHLKKSTNEKN